METFFKDLKHSLRMFRQSPAFTAAAVLALALGIAANTAVFSVVNAVLLKPPPFPEPERLVLFRTTSQQGTNPGGSPAKFQHFREQTGILEDVAAFRSGVLNWTSGETPEQLRSAQVSAGYFRLFGAPVLRGRTFSPEEDRPSGPKVAVISEGLWTRRCGRDPNVVGRTIQLGGDPHSVVGVLSGSFDFRDLSDGPEVWVPFQLDPNTRDQGHYFRVGGRLKP